MIFFMKHTNSMISRNLFDHRVTVFLYFVCVFTFWVQCCGVLNIICVCFRIYWGPTHIMLCFCFLCLRLVYTRLPVSLDCPFSIVPSVFSNIYFVSEKKCDYCSKWISEWLLFNDKWLILQRCHSMRVLSALYYTNTHSRIFIMLLRGEAAYTNFIVCDLTQPRFEYTIYHTRGEHANHYTTNTISNIHITWHCWPSQFNLSFHKYKISMHI